MRTALGALGILLLGSAGFFAYRSTSARDTSSGTSAHVEDRELRKEVDTLRAELRALSARREAQRRQDSPSPAAAAAPVAAPGAEDGDASAKLRLKDVVKGMTSEQKEAYLSRLQKLETKRRVELTEAEIASEPRDHALQAQVEAEAKAALATLDAGQFPTTRLSSVECGSTLCQIEVDQESADEHQAFNGSFSMDRRTFAVRRGGETDEFGQRRGWTVFVTIPGRRMPRAELEELVALLPPDTAEQGLQ